MTTISYTSPALDQLVADRIESLHADAAAVRSARAARLRRSWGRPWGRRASAGGVAAEPAFLGGRPPTAGTADFDRWSDLLAAHVAEHGIATAERSVAAIVRIARRRGASTPALEVLSARDEPVSARERALGLVLGQLTRPVRRASRAGESSVA